MGMGTSQQWKSQVIGDEYSVCTENLVRHHFVRLMVDIPKEKPCGSVGSTLRRRLENSERQAHNKWGWASWLMARKLSLLSNSLETWS